MKKVILIILILCILPGIFALNLDINKLSEKEVVIKDSGKPVSFNMSFKNLGSEDNLMFYSYATPSMHPKGTVNIKDGETKEVQLQFYYLEDLTNKEYLTFEYFIRSQDGSELKENLLVRIVELQNAFEAGASDLNPESNSVTIYLHNKLNFNFENLNVDFSSSFFNVEKNFSLGPNEKKEFEIQVNQEDFTKLLAGFYTLNSKILFEGLDAEIESIIKFTEKEIIQTTEDDKGFIINTKTIQKENKGNVEANAGIVLKKNIISRLFTTYNNQPDIVDRQGGIVYYSWNRKIAPGETLEVIVKTNWIFPLIVILFLISVVILLKTFTGRNLVLKKSIHFVRTKGGEFGLRITIFIKAKRHIDNLALVDKLPPLVKMFDKFSGDKPVKIDEARKTLEWNFNSLEAGEKRLMSYVVYSKIGILGKFALPSATAIYERNGKISETFSNKAFFVNEAVEKERE
jgi:hypothetical protein